MYVHIGLMLKVLSFYRYDISPKLNISLLFLVVTVIYWVNYDKLFVHIIGKNYDCIWKENIQLPQMDAWRIDDIGHVADEWLTEEVRVRFSRQHKCFHGLKTLILKVLITYPFLYSIFFIYNVFFLWITFWALSKLSKRCTYVLRCFFKLFQSAIV